MASRAAWKRKMALTGNVETTALIKSMFDKPCYPQKHSNNRDVLYSCRTNRALVLLNWYVRFPMEVLEFNNEKCTRLELVFKCYGQHSA